MTQSFHPDEALAREFQADPLGHHSPNLQALLRRFRGEPVAGKYALLRTRHERVWTVVEFSGVKGVPLKQHPGLSFTDWRAAEWAVFQLRWRRHVGRPLSFEDPGLLERLAP